MATPLLFPERSAGLVATASTLFLRSPAHRGGSHHACRLGLSGELSSLCYDLSTRNEKVSMAFPGSPTRVSIVP